MNKRIRCANSFINLYSNFMNRNNIQKKWHKTMKQILHRPIMFPPRSSLRPLMQSPKLFFPHFLAEHGSIHLIHTWFIHSPPYRWDPQTQLVIVNLTWNRVWKCFICLLKLDESSGWLLFCRGRDNIRVKLKGHVSVCFLYLMQANLIVFLRTKWKQIVKVAGLVLFVHG